MEGFLYCWNFSCGFRHGSGQSAGGGRFGGLTTGRLVCGHFLSISSESYNHGPARHLMPQLRRMLSRAFHAVMHAKQRMSLSSPLLSHPIPMRTVVMTVSYSCS